MHTLAFLAMMGFFACGGLAVLLCLRPGPRGRRSSGPPPAGSSPALARPVVDDQPDDDFDRHLFPAVRQFLVEAELHWSLRRMLAWGIVIVLSVVMAAYALEIPAGWVWTCSLACPVIGGAALLWRRQSRLRAFREQLPEVVSLMARSTRAGLSLEQSLELARQMSRGRLSAELGHCGQQLSLGLSLPGAMGSFARRTRLREVSLFSTILSIHRETGGGLVEALERLSLLMRDRLTFHQQMLSATSAGRLSAKLIAPVAPIMFVLLLFTAPDHTEIFFSTPLGRTFLLLGIALQIVGIAWIWVLISDET